MAFHPMAFEKASAAWAPTHRECGLGVHRAPGTHTAESSSTLAGTPGAPGAGGTGGYPHPCVLASLVGAQACAQCLAFSPALD